MPGRSTLPASSGKSRQNQSMPGSSKPQSRQKSKCRPRTGATIIASATAKAHERLNSVKIFMDESGNGDPSLPLIIGAVELGEDAGDIEEKIQNLYKSLSARSNLVGLR